MTSRWARIAFVLAAVLLAAALFPGRSRAELWCASPLWTHEWGVVVFGRGTAARTAGPQLPAHFHGPQGHGASSPAAGPAVRDLPVDGGERALPVLSFYTAGTGQDVPVGLEVGFRHGEASRWFPEVDARRTLAEVTSPSALAERARLLAARQSRPRGAITPLGRDPARQLAWDHLDLDASPRFAVPPASQPWVQALRDDPRALWVSRTAAGATGTTGESERFVFYEGQTREQPAITIERGPTYAAGRRHLVLRNTSPHAVHDVFLVHREAGHVYVLSAPTIPARASAGFVLEDHSVQATQLASATREALRSAIVDPRESAAPTGYSWGGPNGCVMQRDPAIPVESTIDHRLYAREADVILDAWGARFFDAPGTTIVYREDVAQLDEVMPIAVYTDMTHFVVLRRLGLALVEGVTLP